jgi:hypothetical protein
MVDGEVPICFFCFDKYSSIPDTRNEYGLFIDPKEGCRAGLQTKDTHVTIKVMEHISTQTNAPS